LPNINSDFGNLICLGLSLHMCIAAAAVEHRHSLAGGVSSSGVVMHVFLDRMLNASVPTVLTALNQADETCSDAWVLPTPVP
jgi:hypothetical protein